jgi:CYTH domain-containing protein
MIENELKFVVRWDQQLEIDLKQKYGSFDIEQIYLNERTRVRRKSSAKTEQFLFTYKQRTQDGRNIEIETPISKNDYDELIKFSSERLAKSRVSVQRENLQWDIDFFQWSHGQYFILAEVEMPPSMDQPPSILEELQPYLVHSVLRHDSRFTSRRLINENHVRSLAQQLGL